MATRADYFTWTDGLIVHEPEEDSIGKALSKYPALDAAKKAERSWTTTLRDLFDTVKGSFTLKDLEEAVKSGSVTQVLQTLDLDQAIDQAAKGVGLQPAETSLIEQARRTFEAGARAALDQLDRVQVQKANPYHDEKGRFASAYSGQVWNRTQAEEFLGEVKDELHSAGYDVKIIGSVATRGQSQHDADFLLTPRKGREEDFNLEPVLESMTRRGWKWDFTGDADEVLEVHVPKKGVVDFFFSDPASKANPCHDEEGKFCSTGQHSEFGHFQSTGGTTAAGTPVVAPDSKWVSRTTQGGLHAGRQKKTRNAYATTYRAGLDHSVTYIERANGKKAWAIEESRTRIDPHTHIAYMQEIQRKEGTPAEVKDYLYQRFGISHVSKVEKATIGTELSFDLLNPKAIDFLRAYAFDLIRQISQGTRESIRDVILEGFQEGKHPYEQAREIRDFIGLTTAQARAVRNYRRMLESGSSPDLREALTRALRDGRFDSTLLTAANTGGTLSQGKVDAMVARYQERYLSYRAQTIARTETLRASNAGQQFLWEDAVDQGLLQEDKTRRYWVTTPDERLCPVCEAIPRQNPKGVRMGEPFQTDLGAIDYPPAHPSCRCATSLHFI